MNRQEVILNNPQQLWMEQPENYPTALALRPYPKDDVKKLFKGAKACSWHFNTKIVYADFGRRPVIFLKVKHLVFKTRIDNTTLFFLRFSWVKNSKLGFNLLSKQDEPKIVSETSTETKTD